MFPMDFDLTFDLATNLDYFVLGYSTCQQSILHRPIRFKKTDLVL